MRRPAVPFSIAFFFAAAILMTGLGAQAAPPNSIKACQEISEPGSYVLERNLTSTGDCLVITASFVTIDLAGFSISISSSQGAAVSVSSTSQLQGIAVRNGSISAQRGVILSDQDLAGGADGSIVENLRISVVAFAITFPSPNIAGIRAKGIVRGNTVVGGPFAIGISASGIITDNYVACCSRGGTGIAADGIVRGNFQTESDEGIFVSAGSTVIGNTATHNRRGLEMNCPSNLTDNTAVNNAENLRLVGAGCNNTNNVAP